MNIFSLKSLKLTLLAASAGALIAAADASAAPGPHSPIEYAVVMTDAVPPIDTSPTELETAAPISLAKSTWFAAMLAAALAVGIKLIGKQRIDAAAAFARPFVEKAFGATAKVARALGSAALSPLRFAAALAAIGLFSFTGIDLMNLEWLVGIVVGAVLIVFAASGYGHLHKGDRIDDAVS